MDGIVITFLPCTASFLCVEFYHHNFGWWGIDFAASSLSRACEIPVHVDQRDFGIIFDEEFWYVNHKFVEF